MSCNDIEAASEYCDGWNSLETVRKRHLLFALLRRLDCPIFVAKISEEMRQNDGLADVAPNFITALKTYIVLPSSSCKAERSFCTLCRLKTCL